MLTKKNRITKALEFKAVYRKGKTVIVDDVVINFKGNDLGEVRVGIVVGNNFSKRAVERNRIKRQIREILRQKLEEIRPGADIVIIMRPTGKATQKKRESREISKTIEMGLRKAGLIKK